MQLHKQEFMTLAQNKVTFEAALDLLVYGDFWGRYVFLSAQISPDLPHHCFAFLVPTFVISFPEGVFLFTKMNDPND